MCRYACPWNFIFILQVLNEVRPIAEGFIDFRRIVFCGESIWNVLGENIPFKRGKWWGTSPLIGLTGLGPVVRKFPENTTCTWVVVEREEAANDHAPPGASVY